MKRYLNIYLPKDGGTEARVYKHPDLASALKGAMFSYKTRAPGIITVEMEEKETVVKTTVARVVEAS